MTHKKARLTGLFLLAVWAAAQILVSCTGTPMPIPPSFDPDRVSLVVEQSIDECPEGCLFIVGESGATEPGATVVAHRVTLGDDPDPFPVYVAVSDDDGGFEALIIGSRVGLYRVLIHGRAGATSIDFELPHEEPGLVALEPLEEMPDEVCVSLTPESIDFGAVPQGRTATALVSVNNHCDESVAIESTEAVVGPWGEPFDVFGTLFRPSVMIEPGQSSNVVVAFWPEEPLLLQGAVLVNMIGLPEIERVLLSVPVAGTMEEPAR